MNGQNARRPQEPGEPRAVRACVPTDGAPGTGRAVALAYAREGADVPFTRLFCHLPEEEQRRGIRVDAVAPGPVWTPEIPNAAGGVPLP